MTRILVRSSGAAVFSLAIAGAAAAQEPPFPTFTSAVDTSTFFISTDNEGADDTQNMFVSVNPNFTLEWWDNVFLSGGLNVTDYPPADKDSFFEYEDLTISDISLFASPDWTWSAQFGKTSVPFGLAPSNAPGLFGSNFVGDYTFDGIMALGGYDVGRYIGEGAYGSHNFIAGSYFVDTTFMSASLFGEVPRTELSDGGPANTENFDSFFVTYDAQWVPILPGGVNYRASYIYNAAGLGDTGHEEGWSLGTVVPLPLAGRDALSSASGEYLAITAVAEYAHFNNFGGVGGVDHDYWTAGVQAFYGQWFATGTTTIREIDNPTLGDQTDHLYAVSAGYSFNNAMSVQLGYAYQDIPAASSHVVGLSFNYAFQLTDNQSWWPNFGKPAYVETNEQLLHNWQTQR